MVTAVLTSAITLSVSADFFAISDASFFSFSRVPMTELSSKILPLLSFNAANSAFSSCLSRTANSPWKSRMEPGSNTIKKNFCQPVASADRSSSYRHRAARFWALGWGIDLQDSTMLLWSWQMLHGSTHPEWIPPKWRFLLQYFHRSITISITYRCISCDEEDLESWGQIDILVSDCNQDTSTGAFDLKVLISVT